MKTLKHFTGSLGFWMALVIALFYTGCNNDGVSVTDSPEERPRFNFQLSDWHEVGSVNGTLRIDTVKILMKDIQLNTAPSNQTQNFKVGPIVIVMTPGNSARLNYIHYDIIPTGTYDKVHFKIHKPAGNETPPDPESLDGNSRYSIIVKGAWDGQQFVFKSDVNCVQMITFPNNLVVTQTSSNVTLRTFAHMWFYDENHYMNPLNPNNRSKIERNIRENVRGNFRAFQDEDANGEPD